MKMMYQTIFIVFLISLSSCVGGRLDESQELYPQIGSILAQSGRIVGGSNVSTNLYPWFALSTTPGGFCGGVLISPEYVLTAAHCIHRKQQWVDNGGFEIGAFCDPNEKSNCGTKSEKFGVKEVTIHHLYEKSTFKYDFALIKLDGSSTIKPANIDDVGMSKSYEYVDSQNLWAVGFGLLESGKYAIPDHLQHVDVKYYTNKECETKYQSYIFDGTSMMCAAKPGKDACAGDSGGPLYDKESDKVVGLTSWGIGCAYEDYPGVYSRISSAFWWIKHVTCNDLDATNPSFCPCDQSETFVELKVEDMSDGDGKVIMRMKKHGQLLHRHRFKKNGTRGFCFPRDTCVNAYINVKAPSRSGRYKIIRGGEVVLNETFDGQMKDSLKFNCE